MKQAVRKSIAVSVLLLLELCMALAACGKKPAQLQPIAAPTGSGPTSYSYPHIQTPPPALPTGSVPTPQS